MDVVNGLRFCHAKHLVHLDVKPQNVFVAVVGSSLSPSYVCKLFDFGCSSFISQENSSVNQVRENLLVSYQEAETLYIVRVF